MINMQEWKRQQREDARKKAMPILSFPSISLMDITVRELIADADVQAKGMKLIADRVPSSASVSMMDLSVEAEAFGAAITFSDDEVPTVRGILVEEPEDADELAVPEVGAGRTGLYISAIEKAAKLIEDRPVFAGIIGPFSLAGRLMGVEEAMVNCYVEPDMVHTVLRKATDFLIEYAKGYKAVGANGIAMAEPLAGLLSPDMCAEFSEPYVREIFEAIQDDNFLAVYHNCGDGALDQIESILRTGADAFHFGNAISMKGVLDKVPEDVIVMGNVDPAKQICNGTPESVREETLRIMGECCSHPNFVISSGCDIPPISPWANIDAFFAAVDEFYEK